MTFWTAATVIICVACVCEMITKVVQTIYEPYEEEDE